MQPSIPNRAGVYVQQSHGFKAFIPKPLPPDPPIKMDAEMWTLLSRADRALGRLDGSTEILPNPDLFMYMYVRKEAVLSSQIEGTQATLMDILEFESRAVEPDQPGDVEEVVNHVAAINAGLEQLAELPLSLRLLREIHRVLMTNVRGRERTPGEFRRSQNWIGGTSPTTARYVPPPVHEMHAALDNFEKFLHNDEPMPVLVKVGLAHAQFETVHPFLDGNGRMGRLLITFLLCQMGVMKLPLLYLSHYFKLNRSEYYDRLQAIRDSGDWEGWLKFFLNGVGDVADEATITARHIVSMREEHQELVRRHFKSPGNALGLLNGLYFRPIVDVPSVAMLSEISYAHANTLVREFQQLGLLRETTGYKRNRRFAYDSYLALFQDEQPGIGETGREANQ